MYRIFVLIISVVMVPQSLPAQGLGSFRSARQESKAVRIQTSRGSLVFRAFPDSILQTEWLAIGETPPQISNAVIIQPVTGLSYTQRGETLVVRYGSLEVELSGEPLQASYRQSGIELFQWKETGQNSGQPFVKYSLAEGEKIYGTGSRSIPLDRRGYRIGLNNNPWYAYNINADNLNYSIPFYLSTRNYGLFFDNPARGYMDIGSADTKTLEIGVVGGPIQFYVMTAPRFGPIVRKFTRLVGRQPLAPRWAYGNFMSRYGYRNQEQVMEIVGKMKSAGYPMDAVVIDLFWFGDAKHGSWNMGNLDWNRQRFPQPDRMLQQLKALDLKTLLVTEPFVLQESVNFRETMDQGLHASDKNGDTVTIREFYFGYAGLLDIFRNRTQDWFWKQYKKEIQRGVDGWWGDLGEPEKHPDYLYHDLKDLGVTERVNADLVHNIYGHWWSRMLHERYRREFPNTRLFHLNRSGYAGSWRYSSFPWSGDVERSWNGLRAQLPILQGMSLSGVPFMHSDAGGFALGQRDPELYRRWLQMSIFTPVFRPHGSVSDPNPEIPAIESEPVFYDSATQRALLAQIRLRYRLMPYIYTLGYQATVDGSPLIRPMVWGDRADTNLYRANGQYMFGDALLVKPITDPGRTTDSIYLPIGRWYNFYTEQVREGYRWVVDSCRFDYIPVYVRGGSLIPMRPDFTNTEAYPKESLVIHYYPAMKLSSGVWYEDDGKDPEALQKRAYTLYTMKAEPTGDALLLSLQSNAGNYPGKPSQMKVEWILHAQSAPVSIIVDGRVISLSAQPGGGAWYDDSRRLLHIHTTYRQAGQRIQLKYH